MARGNFTNHPYIPADNKKQQNLREACKFCKRAKEELEIPLTDDFLRKPYQYTTAETKDDTQENMHKYDYLK